MNLDYATVFSSAAYVNENIIITIGICLLIGAMAKSSQVGWNKAFKSWVYKLQLFWTWIFAGIVSNALEFASPLNYLDNDSKKYQGQGTNQQGINKLTNLNKFDRKFL